MQYFAKTCSSRETELLQQVKLRQKVYSLQVTLRVICFTVCVSITATQSSSRKPTPSKSPSSHQDGRESERRNEEMEKLRKQIDKYKDIVKQQEELIQVCIVYTLLVPFKSCYLSKSDRCTYLSSGQYLY